MPIIDLNDSYSFAKAHPYWTALEFVVLGALVWFVLWFSRRFPMHMGKIRLGMFAAYLAIALPAVWATFKIEPSPMSQLMDVVHQEQLQKAVKKALESQNQLDADYFFKVSSGVQPEWMPESVKTDGNKTYLLFPPGSLKLERVPYLMDVSNPLKPSGWQFSINGDRMVIYAVVEKAILTSPDGHGQVRIERSTQ